MCEICNVERGNCETLMTDYVEIKIGRNTKLDAHMLAVYIGRDNDGYYYLESSYFGFDDDPMAQIKLPIEYCPFCGRELKRRPKTFEKIK